MRSRHRLRWPARSRRHRSPRRFLQWSPRHRSRRRCCSKALPRPLPSILARSLRLHCQTRRHGCRHPQPLLPPLPRWCGRPDPNRPVRARRPYRPCLPLQLHPTGGPLLGRRRLTALHPAPSRRPGRFHFRHLRRRSSPSLRRCRPSLRPKRYRYRRSPGGTPPKAKPRNSIHAQVGPSRLRCLSRVAMERLQRHMLETICRRPQGSLVACLVLTGRCRRRRLQARSLDVRAGRESPPWEANANAALA